MNLFHKLYHCGKKAYDKKHRITLFFCKTMIRLFYHCNIPFEADIDSTVWFCHSGFGTVINPRCKIGKNVVIQHRVTIGEICQSGGVPLVQNDVFIGAGAILLGDIVIGENSKIGAGAVVIHDVPPNSTAVGNPARIILHESKE